MIRRDASWPMTFLGFESGKSRKEVCNITDIPIRLEFLLLRERTGVSVIAVIWNDAVKKAYICHVGIQNSVFPPITWIYVGVNV